MKIILFFLALVVLFTTCKQTEPPCAGAKEPTAAFTIMEVDPYFFGFITYNTDTASPNEIQFTANEPNAKYEWKIGTDTVVFTKQQFSLNFSNYYVNNLPNVPPVTIALKITKNPGPCFPASDSVKYMTRTLYLTEHSLLNGSFQVHFNNDTVGKTIHINTDTIMNFHTGSGIFIRGLPNHDSIFMNDGSGEIPLYRKLIFNFTSTGANLGIDDLGKGEFMVTQDGKTIYGWITQTNPKYPLTYTFTGTRM